MNNVTYIADKSYKSNYMCGMYLRDKLNGSIYFIGNSDTKLGVISIHTGIALKVIDITNGDTNVQMASLIKDGDFEVLNSGRIEFSRDLSDNKVKPGYLLINRESGWKPETVCMVCKLDGIYSLICIDDGNRYFEDSNSIAELFDKVNSCRFRFDSLKDKVILDCRQKTFEIELT